MKPRIPMIAALIGALGSALDNPLEPTTPILRRRSRPAPRIWYRPRTGGLKPHQGERECARRRGGADWEAYKAADRVRRGLPACKGEV